MRNSPLPWELTQGLDINPQTVLGSARLFHVEQWPEDHVPGLLPLHKSLSCAHVRLSETV
jgi:hypothetical protein